MRFQSFSFARRHFLAAFGDHVTRGAGAGEGRHPSATPMPRSSERPPGIRGGACRPISFRTAESPYRRRCRMLDSAPMSYWRKLFVIVLLVLSLPVQALAAVSMNCELARADGGGAPARHLQQAAAENGHGAHDMNFAADDHRHPEPRGAHHAHACATCISCCIGAGLPAGSTVAASFDAPRIALSLPRDARAVSFLTGGIERPPRIALV
ncbi:hypothetical protein NX907_20565 [Burkholderia thailandensis]|nr:hypothetical protein [Burkholderia thailandensis]MCS3399320.1 hypothetical protein [Burkholderia thailandensis]MCS6472872.1 hypothetical protein [Burkholderia thailandensis]MCS6478764.1 hypothetical protein [Burkholderia thailandensis]MCS6507996.1 hypothetical protein [Burkholderia thailandensis]